MKTLTIEFPDEAVSAAEALARRGNMTLPEWIRARITGHRRLHRRGTRDAMGYPVGWFERTAAALADVEDFRRPEDRPATPVQTGSWQGAE